MTQQDTTRPDTHTIAAHDVDTILAAQGIRAILRLMGVDPDRPDLHDISTRLVTAITDTTKLIKSGETR